MFGDPNYISHEKIELPLNFGNTDIIGIDKSNIALKAVAGDDATLMDYHILSGLDQANNPVKNEYKIIFEPAHNTWGAVLAQFVGAVIEQSSLNQSLHAITPILIAYNNSMPTIKDLGTPYKTSDQYWNVPIEFQYPVVNFGIDDLIIGIDYSQPVLYQGQTLDVKPDIPPPAYDSRYNFGGSQTIHCVGDWKYIADSRNTTQARHFHLKFLSDAEEMPEILLREEPIGLDFVKPVPVAPRVI